MLETIFGQKGIGKIQIVWCGFCITDKTNCRCVSWRPWYPCANIFVNWPIQTNVCLGSKNGTLHKSLDQTKYCTRCSTDFGTRVICIRTPYIWFLDVPKVNFLWNMVCMAVCMMITCMKFKSGPNRNNSEQTNSIKQGQSNGMIDWNGWSIRTIYRWYLSIWQKQILWFNCKMSFIQGT